MNELSTLTLQWQGAKHREREANVARIGIESRIYELVADQLPHKGTTTLDTGIKIVTGYSENWDQEEVQRAYETWPHESGVEFPFQGTWKPDGKAISYLRENYPDAYRLIQGALTLTPKKPAFSVKE